VWRLAVKYSWLRRALVRLTPVNIVTSKTNPIRPTIGYSGIADTKTQAVRDLDVLFAVLISQRVFDSNRDRVYDVQALDDHAQRPLQFR
jgi:hypothetical protein